MRVLFLSFIFALMKKLRQEFALETGQLLNLTFSPDGLASHKSTKPILITSWALKTYAAAYTSKVN